MVAVRRRKGRRRTDPPVKRRTLTIMVLSFVTVLTLVAVPGVRHSLAGVRPLISKTHIAPEVWALLLAGVALLFLIPGVEERVLIALGIRKPSRSRNTHR